MFFIHVPFKNGGGVVETRSINLSFIEMIIPEGDRTTLWFTDEGHLTIELSYPDTMGLIPSAFQSGRPPKS